ncbi:hypothetical protein LGZ99_06010 [Photorhabdus temperata]|uniref:Uncharacterized protein n=1 Tax=Photorhabdus temperata subsp. temperata Meg1 TaxID=1393735 RepID=A0A081RXC4_PHOTE|nr:hypothetical protein [Photorhabdus temperata]KER03327.1 hypothetical protein MEG1DRAFT_02005 [Photorhabdus temperata subsp. temperata Meg1]MCT8346778.1 hypothetical protein [Photorhabdus temperata]
MSDIYNHLVRTSFNDMSTEELKDLRMNSEAAFSGVMAALSSIGELGFWAGDNESYADCQAREDLRRIGEALMYLPRIAEALNDTAQHARFEIYHREGFPKW